MRIEIPREVERFGPLMFHEVQKVYELDAGLQSVNGDAEEENSTITRVSYEEMHAIQKEMAIVVPVRNERIKLIEGVLSGIPNHCLVIIVSNSPREPVDRYAMEKDAIEHLGRFMNKRLLMVHQKDLKLAGALRASGYKWILNDKGRGVIKNGKAEGMVVATLLAGICGKKYIGFIDSDNYFPGAVHEYVQEYCAGFSMARSKYSMVRISWHSKPKVVEKALFFAKRGRASEHTNRILNSLLGMFTGYGTEIIKTGNAGEHAISMDLAKRLDFSSGYSIEPYHYINMFEQFAGIIGVPDPKVMRDRIELFQIESRNPHLHEVKGDEHVSDMSRAALEVIANSPICPASLRKAIVEDLHSRGLIENKKTIPRTLSYYPAIENADWRAFASELREEAYAHHILADEDLPGSPPKPRPRKAKPKPSRAKKKPQVQAAEPGMLEIK